jgi:hypothetical protein
VRGGFLAGIGIVDTRQGWFCGSAFRSRWRDVGITGCKPTRVEFPGSPFCADDRTTPETGLISSGAFPNPVLEKTGGKTGEKK